MIRILYTKDEIAMRVSMLGREIGAFYNESNVLVIVLLNGGMIFASDLVRAMELDIELDSMAVSSYDGECSTGVLNYRSKPKNSVLGRDVLLVDDILDTGLTLKNVTAALSAAGAKSVRSAVLFDKQLKCGKQFKADWTGFTLPELFVVGYGLDYNERYRNLPYLGVCEE